MPGHALRDFDTPAIRFVGAAVNSVFCARKHSSTASATTAPTRAKASVMTATMALAAQI
jgi:hypothetical protein